MYHEHMFHHTAIVLLTAASLLGRVCLARAADPETTASIPAASQDNWPLFRGDPHSTCLARGSLPDKLDLLWKFAVPKGSFEGTDRKSVV